MVLEPLAGVRAPRNGGQAVRGSLLDRSAHEPPADPTAPELVGNLGVHQDEPLPVAPVHQLGQRAVLFIDEPVMGGVIDHPVGRLRPAHDRFASSPFPNLLIGLGPSRGEGAGPPDLRE